MNEPKTLQESIPLFKGWWDVNEFEGNVTIEGQFRKLIEEIDELFEGLKKKDEKAIKDALGDIQVVCINGCFIIYDNADIDELPAAELLEIENGLSVVIGCFLVCPKLSLNYIRSACSQLGYDPDECLALAWDEIKDRRGHWENGVFVKHVKKEVLHMTKAPEIGTMVYFLYDDGDFFNWRWDGGPHDLACLENGRVYATRELRDKALALRKKVCQACGGIGLTDGWIPTYSDPDNAGMRKEAEPCSECYQTRKEGA